MPGSDRSLDVAGATPVASNPTTMLEATKLPPVHVTSRRFPYCIVWSPLPPITWILPFIGHMGIADSEGIMFDFAGPYTIGKEKLAFGDPTRYVQLDPRKVLRGTWEESVKQGCTIYSKRNHNLCCDNCHSHVAKCLNLMNYSNSSSWNMVKLCFWVFFWGRYTSTFGFVKTWLPFAIIVLIISLTWM